MSVALKICGMRDNISEIATLMPNYLGFIFYEKSPRFFTGTIPKLPKSVKKVGVFVDADAAFISEKIKAYALDVVQLHGSESPMQCQAISGVEVWKVFSIKDAFNFEQLTPYEAVVDKFLFDTKGKDKGGNGFTFDWRVLKNYNSSKPMVLSGGIGLEEVEKVKNILATTIPIAVIDVNSRFETAPGLKKKKDLSTFKKALAIH